jgi:hypothetical protein
MSPGSSLGDVLIGTMAGSIPVLGATEWMLSGAPGFKPKGTPMKAAPVGAVVPAMIIALLAGLAHAQSASGILAPSRMIDWGTAGYD